MTVYRVCTHEVAGMGARYDLPTHLSELLDLCEVVIDDLWMVVLKVLGKLRDVV